MRITKVENTAERMILIGMIVDPTVCGRIAAKWQPNLFRSKWANLLAGWCVDYYHRYGKPPAKHIEAQYRVWEQKTKDKDTAALVGKLLDSLNSEYKERRRESNSDYILDRAAEHFNQVKIERLRDELEVDLNNGDVGKAQSKIVGFDQVNIGKGEYVDIFHAKEEWKDAFEHPAESIIQYPGKLGEFFGSQLARECFVAFTGPEKRGKSMWLMELSFKAVEQRRKVAFFEAGDMSQRQVMRRQATRITNRPMYPQTINWPTAVLKRKEGKVKVITKEKIYTKALHWKKVLRGCKKYRQKKIRSNESYFRMVCMPNDSLHIRQVESTLREWAREDWVPDVVVIDYADILAMTWPGLEGRDRIDKTWKQMRRLSQDFHCLLLTATQASAKSYDAQTIRKGHFSDDKRKHAHVTAMYGLNQTDAEKEQGVYRINCVELRDGEFREGNCVWVAGVPAVGRLAIRAVM